MKKIKLGKQDYINATNMIIEHIEHNHDTRLGQFEAEFLLDEIVKSIGPALFNLGVDESIKTFRSLSEHTEEEMDAIKLI